MHSQNKITIRKYFVLNQTGVRVILQAETFYTKGETSKLAEFINYFLTIDGMRGKVLLNHNLFGQKTYRCEKINVVNDDDKIGVRLMGQDLYILKKDIKLGKVSDKMFILADDIMQITIIVN